MLVFEVAGIIWGGRVFGGGGRAFSPRQHNVGANKQSILVVVRWQLTVYSSFPIHLFYRFECMAFSWPANFSGSDQHVQELEEEKTIPPPITTTSSSTISFPLISTSEPVYQPFVSQCLDACLTQFTTPHLLALRKSYESKSELERTEYLVTMRKNNEHNGSTVCRTRQRSHVQCAAMTFVV